MSVIEIGNNLIVFTAPSSTASSMDWSVVDLRNLSGGITQSGDSIIAGLSLNVLDNYLYGYDIFQHEIVRVDSDFQLTYLGLPQGMSQYINWAATIDTNGFMYLSGGVSTSMYYTVDLRPGSGTYMQLVDPTDGYLPITSGKPYIPTQSLYVAGWTALSDGKLYGLYYGTGVNAGKMVCVDPTTGDVTFLETNYQMPSDYQFRAIVRDINDDIYAISAMTGTVFKFTISNDIATGTELGTLDLGYMYLDAVLSPFANPFGLVANTAELDVVSCDGEEPTTIQSNKEEVEIVDIVVEKTANCPIAFVGGTIQYCITVTNPSLHEFQSTFRDVLDSRLEYVDGSFTVDGTTQTPTISGQEISHLVTIPADSTVTICFKVKVH